MFGENLTVAGVDVSGAVLGETWAVATCVLQVRQPRLPCYKLGIRLGDDRFTRRFLLGERPGAYLRIVSEGAVAAGDEVVVSGRRPDGLTVRDVAIAHRERRSDLLERLRDELDAPDDWRAWAAAKLTAGSRRSG
jgi:MOSC domain-containing protein YiiM